MPERLLFLMSIIQNRLTSHIKRELKKEGVHLSTGQAGILMVLDQKMEAAMGQVSQTLEMDHAALTRLADKLEKQGLAERRINPNDRRQMLLSITPKGKAQAAVVKKVANKANTRILDGFTKEEKDVFIRVSKGILKKF